MVTVCVDEEKSNDGAEESNINTATRGIMT